jgi:hypothetical protein
MPGEVAGAGYVAVVAFLAAAAFAVAAFGAMACGLPVFAVEAFALRHSVTGWI